MRFRNFLHASLCLLTIVSVTPSNASLILWDGDTSTDWSDGANWIVGSAPANNTNTDQAGFVFSTLPAFQPNTGTRDVNGLVIGDGLDAVPAFEISGVALTLGNGGILKNSATSNTTISPNITLAADQTWTNDSASALVVTGQINNAGFDLAFDGNGFARSTGQIQGSGTLTKSGSGTLLLEGNSTYTGGTIISAGTLRAGLGGKKSTLGADSRSLTFNGTGATLQLEGTILDSARSYFFDQTGTIDTNGFDLILGGGISGDGGVVKTGNGTLTLNATASHAGGTTIRGGMFTISPAGSITDPDGDMVVGELAGDNGVLLVSGGSVENNWSILGNDSGSTGTANMTGGSWTTNGNFFVGYLGSGTLELSGGNLTVNIYQFHVGNEGDGILQMSGGNLSTTNSFLGTEFGSSGNATLTGGTWINSNNLSVGPDGTATLSISGNAVLEVGGTLSRGAGGTIDLGTGGTLQIGSGGATGTLDTDLVNNGHLIFNRTSASTYSGSISGTGMLTKNSSGTLTLTGNNTHSGGTTLNEGRINIDNSNALGSGTFVIAGGSIDSTTPGITLNNTPQNWNADFSFVGTNDLNLGSGAVMLNASRTLTIEAGNLTVGGSISGANFGLTKNGSGKLVLSGANSYSGNTTVNAGTLAIGVSDSLADSSNLIVAGGAFDLDGFHEPLGSISGAGNILLGAGTLTTISSENSSFSGTISGIGSLIKGGSGSLELTGSNSYSGATTINSGTLAVNGSIADSAVTIANGGTLAGSGLVEKTVISSGGRISPGNSVGILDTDDLTLEGGGGYNWEIANVSGTPGTDWDLIRSGGGSGNATITATPASKFTIFVLGNPTGWDPSTSYLWNIIDWGAVTGFDANAFAVDATGFTGAAPIGTWALANSGGFLSLGYFVGDPKWSGGAGNWSTGFFPPLTNGANIVFTGTGGISTNDIAAGTITSIGSLTFDLGAGPFTLRANPGSSGYNASSPLTLGGDVINNSTATQTLELALDLPAARTFQNSPGDLILSGPISGAGSLIKTGPGSLFLLNDLQLGGPIEIQQGLLSINSRATLSGLTVWTGAMLGGTGRIFGNVLNRGSVSPGNSIGTLTIAGDYQQTSSGSLDIEIASPSSFDRLVVGGQASLAGTLRVIPIEGNSLAYGEKYAFLQAGSISGSFETINAPEGFRGRFLSDDTTGILLIAPDSYTRVAVTPNQRSVAGALDSFISATSGDRLEVSIALDELTESQFPSAFDQITPGFYETLADLAIEQAFVQTQLLNQRFGSLRLGVNGFQTLGLPEQPIRNDRDGSPVGDFGLQSATPTNWSAWVLGSGSFSRSAGVSEIPDYRNDAGGFLAGADHRWSDGFSTGLYAGYQYNFAKYDGGGSSRGNSVLFGGYANFSRDGYYADALVGGGYTGWQTRRSIEFGTFDRTARAEPGSGQFTAALNLGKDWQIGNLTLGPLAGAQYTYAGVGPFTENGADSLDLSLGQQDANSLRTTLGGRIAYSWDLNQNLTLVPEIRMLWLHEFLDYSRTIDAALDGGSGPVFGFDTANPERDSVFAGAVLGLRIGRAWTASAFYNVNFGNPDFSNNIVSLSLGARF